MKPILCLVTNRQVTRIPLAEAIEAAVAGGVDWVQIREQGLEDAALLDLAKTIRDAARRGAKYRAGTVEIWMNRRVDLTLTLGLNAVHLGRGALSTADARTLLGPAAKISRSAHSPANIVAAAAQGADAAQLAPIFSPLSKRVQEPPLGCGVLTHTAVFGIPVLAQGGITPQNCEQAIRAGAAGIAVTGAILQDRAPAEVARAFRHALDGVTRSNLS